MFAGAHGAAVHVQVAIRIFEALSFLILWCVGLAA